MTRAEKIQIIKDAFPDLMQIDPYMHTSKVDEVKDYLFAVGAYKSHKTQLPDSIIVNLILNAQGKKVVRIFAKNRDRRFA